MYRFVEEGRGGEAMLKVLHELDINPSDWGSGTSYKVPCPRCKKAGHFCGVDTRKGVGKCHKCDIGFNPVSYMEEYSGFSKKEALARIDVLMGYNERHFEKPHYQQAVITACVNQGVPKRSDGALNRCYSLFLRKLHLRNNEKETLLKRGFFEGEVRELGYVSCPDKSHMSDKDMFQLAEDLAYDDSYDYVPGFLKAVNGSLYFQRQPFPGIFIPVKNRCGEIVGLQIRRDSKYLKEHDARYIWFSSKSAENEEKKGAGASVRIHYACEFKDGIPVHSGRFFLTEGPLKGDLAHKISGFPFICVPGVNAIKSLAKELEYLKGIGVKEIILAYDMDYKTNPNVQAAMEKTQAIIRENGMVCRPCLWQPETEKGDLLKGIDDYFAWRYRGINPSEH